MDREGFGSTEPEPTEHYTPPAIEARVAVTSLLGVAPSGNGCVCTL